MRLLIVDDEVEALEGISFYFSARNHEVFSAQEGREALERVESCRPQLMLLDLKMKGISGFEIMKEARKIMPELTIVVITGVSQENLEEECRRLGAARVIYKPVKVGDLDGIVEWAMARGLTGGPRGS